MDNELTTQSYEGTEGGFIKRLRLSSWVPNIRLLIQTFYSNKRARKIFEVDGTTIVFKYMGYRSSHMEIWYESERVKKLLEDMPYANAVQQVFEAYKKESKLKFRYLLITDEIDVCDNWFYESERTWVITLKGVLFTIRNTLERKKVNLFFLDRYLIEQGISL